MPYYLRIAGIDGDSTSRGHEKWFEAATISWGAHSTAAPASGSGGGAGRPVLEPLHVGLKSGRSTPLLFQAVVTGRHIAAATLDVVTSGERRRTALSWSLTDVQLTSLELSGAGDAAMDETLVLSYGGVTLAATGQDPKGGVTPGPVVGWDVGRNQTV